MLRITSTVVGDVSTARVEGRIAGPWVKELLTWWEIQRLSLGDCSCSLDLSEVSFIDTDGRTALRRLAEEGVELHARGCMTCAIVDEIVQEARHARSTPARGPTVRPAEERD